MKEKHGKSYVKKCVNRDRAESHKWQETEEIERDGGRVVSRGGILGSQSSTKAAF